MEKKIYDEPICGMCSNCLMLKKITGRRYEIDCKSNPNLGGVCAGYAKCPGFKLKL